MNKFTQLYKLSPIIQPKIHDFDSLEILLMDVRFVILINTRHINSATTNDQGIIVISPEENYNIYDIVKDGIDVVSEVEIDLFN